MMLNRPLQCSQWYCAARFMRVLCAGGAILAAASLEEMVDQHRSSL
jgi:hypothetical protein